ncbi:YopT-type cysteine protease domain-containing protein [Humitalea sp. 24SJ18S-53]|uniref:YopT-type cysteine protease domain-containing protein n=1 Tax=Humitalea sp. 24SJ18S-53 TaxID=3422307 RepID=UPI003D66F0F1
MGLIADYKFRTARNALPGFNGVMTWDYAQSGSTTMWIMNCDSASRWGICKAMAAQWIVDHAYGGSLRNRLTDAKGELDTSQIKMVTANFLACVRSQGTATSEFLFSRGLRERMASLQREVTRETTVNRQRVTQRTIQYTSDSMAAVGAGNVAIELTNALRKISNSYVQIDFGRPDGIGHATCAWIGGATYGSSGDAIFFDPNCGEYWFARKADFFAWFRFFYQVQYQNSFNGYWAAKQWSLAVGAEKSAYAKAVRTVVMR